MLCPCCEQELPPHHSNLKVIPGRGLVVKGDKFSQLTQSQMTIFNEIYEKMPLGVVLDRLVEVLYQHRPDGGPLTAHNTVHVMVAQANRRLQKLNVRITAGRGYRFTNYKVVETK